MTNRNVASLAFRFVLIAGIVNLFADMTYEGARANIGPFFGSLGASATVVGLVAGSGELLGYALRSVSGYIADKTHSYWPMIFAGYFINMLSVPALALAGSWPSAGALTIAERTGKAIRKPSVEAMLSHAGKSIGRGWVFGLNEALDQAGATAGPVITAWVLSVRGSYHAAFAALLVPAVLCLVTLTVARAAYPRPQELEERTAQALDAKGFSKAYWAYLAAGALIACGFADFSLIAFHFQKAAAVPRSLIPIFYAAAMAAGAAASLALGRLFDKAGPSVTLPTFVLSALATPMVFLGGSNLALAGVILWGAGMGAQDTLLKAVVAGVAPADRRSTAFGVFDTGFGVAWFLGSAAMGMLYDRSVVALAVFSIAIEVAALPVLLFADRSARPLAPR